MGDVASAVVNGGAIVDVVALIFLGMFALWGFIKGFTKTFFSTFGTLLSLLFAILLSSLVAKFLEDKFGFVTTISGWISEFLYSLLGKGLMSTPLKDVSSGTFESVGLSSLIVQLIFMLQADGSLPGDLSLGQIICPAASFYVAQIICIVALFIVFKIIFFLIGEVVKSLHSNPIVATVDKTLGLVLGLINGIVNLEFIIIVIGVIPISFFQEVSAYITASTVAGFIHSINIYGLLVGAVSNNNIIDVIKQFLVIK